MTDHTFGTILVALAWLTVPLLAWYVMRR